MIVLEEEITSLEGEEEVIDSRMVKMVKPGKKREEENDHKVQLSLMQNINIKLNHLNQNLKRYNDIVK